MGIAVTLAVYYPWAKATNSVPAESIYPEAAEGRGSAGRRRQSLNN
ncbi:hypothetical protein ARTSIC4J27_3965 [Pseudarthrobacter siccitolerans]|uniref:Uncharacterized protein n=1 Tax=Pseudarthrobacter siccitolerans TaxID=861266 RepID=A0A024H7P5_9MICC|nr:hypothetical protein [Pseudarthrobacter siccitolerans]CCQ47968.1 hypothetical protein ARTSIC4J27_3965 [Pseudarthrobacter siccitolerans]